MQKKDIQILIVDDDETMGKAMKAALEREGYSATMVSSSNEALSLFKVHDYRAVISDCMLPRIDGVKLMEQMRASAMNEFYLVLVSGIYKNRDYIREATARTNAQLFLTKPFDLEELTTKINEHFAGEIDTERTPLQKLLTLATPSRGDRQRALSETENIHGYELPFVYSNIAQSDLSGVLTLSAEGRDDEKIYFSKGKIFRVHINDKESYFGVLLIEKGFTTPAEVEAGLALSDSSKPIGKRLVDINSLSPHAIQVIQMEQMMIRLSKTVQDTHLTMSFETQPVTVEEAYLESTQVYPLLSDWVASKISLDWLKSTYLTWLDFTIAPGPNSASMASLSQLHVAQNTPGIVEQLKGQPTVQELFENTGANEEDVYRSLHLLLISGAISLGRAAQNQSDFQRRLQRVLRVQKDIEGKNHFEVLGLSQQARPNEINRAYHDLAKALHPDKVPLHAPDELRKVTEDVFARINSAYNVLSDQKGRLNYLKELEHGKVEEALAAEENFNKAYRSLISGKYRKAYERFKEVHAMKGHRADVPAFLVWSGVKAGGGQKNPVAWEEKMTKLLSQVPPEDRHAVPYYMARGMYHSFMGNFDKSYKYFKNALAQDPNNIAIKRELASLKSAASQRKQKGALSGDFSSVVTKFFRGKKSS